MRKEFLQVGATVKIINIHKMYYRYEEMANLLGAKNWKEKRRITTGVYKVINWHEHLDIKHRTVVLLLEKSTGYEYLINVDGLELIKYVDFITEEDFSV